MEQTLLQKLVNLDGRVVIVAGAGGGGMGTLITRLVAEAGATVVAVDLYQESLDKHVAPLAEEGLSIVPIVADIGNEAGVAAVLDCARAAPGDLYGLVTIIGGIPDRHWGPSIGVSRESWDWVLGYNLDSMFFMTQAVAKELRAKRLPGSLVSISSMTGFTATPFHIAYGASKAAIVSVVKTMALELAADGIRVNSIAPGAIGTPTAAKAPDKARDSWAVPMQRQGLSEEIAGPVLFLLSDMAGYTTGQTLIVDGGCSLKWSHLDGENVPAFARDTGFMEAWRNKA